MKNAHDWLCQSCQNSFVYLVLSSEQCLNNDFWYLMLIIFFKACQIKTDNSLMLCNAVDSTKAFTTWHYQLFNRYLIDWSQLELEDKHSIDWIHWVKIECILKDLMQKQMNCEKEKVKNKCCRQIFTRETESRFNIDILRPKCRHALTVF